MELKKKSEHSGGIAQKGTSAKRGSGNMQNIIGACSYSNYLWSAAWLKIWSIGHIGLTILTRAGGLNFYRFPIPLKFSKLLLPTPSKKFYLIAIRKYIISFYYYFRSLIASNKYIYLFGDFTGVAASKWHMTPQ